MNKFFLTIIIPCFNEKKTILKVISQIKKIKKIKKQIILVDDGSNDGSKELITKRLNHKVDKIIFHSKNMGKGAAIISSSKFVKGDLVLIQDADLEYSPKDYHKLVKPFLKDDTKVVYGSRVLGRKKEINFLNLKEFSKNFRIFGNFVLTQFSNLVNDQSLTDVHTCYKILRKDIFLKLKLKEKGFSFCPEVTTKLSNISCPIIEVPISYKGREIKDGKKIRFSDAFDAIFTIVKHKIFN